MIYVCGLEDMPRYVAALRPSHLVSVMSPDELPPTPPGLDPARHLRIACHDIVEPLPGHVLPEARHVESLVAFAREWAPASPMLVHCLAGVSRSTAAALIAAVVHAPGQEALLARRLRAAAPHANPNRRLIALADEILGCNGRLVEAVRAIGPGAAVVTDSLAGVALHD